MGWLDSFFHPEKGYQKGQEELNRYYQQAQQYNQPYFNQGQSMYGPLQSIIGNLLNPQALQSQWAQSYQESPQAQLAEQMAGERGMGAASSMGLLGSNAALSGIQRGQSQIAMDDRQNYMNDLMQKYLQGAGLTQGVYGMGANAGNQLGQNAMNMGQNSANMAFGQQNAPGSMFGNLLGAGIGLAGSALGGGFSPKNQYNPWSANGQYSGGR